MRTSTESLGLNSFLRIKWNPTIAIVGVLLSVFVFDPSVAHPQNPTGSFRPNQPPSFVSGGDLSRFSIPEDTAVGSVIYRLKGTDPENGELTFSISGEYFRVNRKTGDITLIKALDREVEPKIDVIISLTDDGQGSEPSTVSLRREIYVQDRNDNPPIFHKRPYSFKVIERTRVGSTVYADIPITDEDFGINSQIKLNCSYEDSPLACKTFNVVAEKVGDGKYIGIISLAIPLDYETHSSYAMTLIATDGVNNATALVAISILDLQDQAPKFYGGPYVFKVRENVPPGTKVGEISVQDADVGNPRDLQLRLIDEAENKYFRLTNILRDGFTGTYNAFVETTNYTIDAEDDFIRENLGVYELILEAREIPLNPDDLEPTLTTRTGVAVMIEDADDHLPEFRPAKFTRVLRLPYNINEPWSFPDFRVEVEDGDVDPFNSKFDLKFSWNLDDEEYPVPVDEVFSFVTPSNDNPTIQSKGMVSMEVSNISLLSPGLTFDLQIGAYQKGHLVSNLNVPIEVAPGPKVLPAFSENVYRIAVPEDIPEGGLIAKIAAKNHDEIEGIKYNLIGAGREKFSVDEDTGEIRCKGSCLDFEKDKSHFFLIRAKAGDAVDEEVFALFNLDVVEKNDNKPEFIDVPGLVTLTPNGKLMKRTVPDGTKKFDPPFYVKATDADLNDKITYSLLDHSMNTSGIEIDPSTGELVLTKPLRWAEGGEHRLTITATDSTGKSSFQTVLIVVQAVSNIPPSFPYAIEQVQVPETLEKGGAITSVKAHDPDGQDASLRYSIEDQPVPDLFTIEESSGTLRLNGQLDYDSPYKSFRIQVRAEDQGKPSESALAFVEINILPVNDEAPKFPMRNYAVEISESSMPDAKVMTLEAKDGDGDDALLEYSISCPCQVWDSSGSMGTSEDAQKHFKNLKVNPETGVVSLLDNFSHKQSAVLEFRANVVDRNADEIQSDTATVTLYVTAAERDKPIFGHPWTTGNPWINLTIPEDINVTAAIISLNAWDFVDAEPVTDFQIVQSDSENFKLENGNLTVISELDYETKDMHKLVIQARDKRGGTSLANIGIQITDANDHAPNFAKQEYKGKVTENAAYPTPILTVQATDLDDPKEHGSIRYSLTGPQNELFTIDPLAGVVQVAPGALIDREKDSSHLLSVLAVDTPSGGPFQRTATASLSILVEDENDNDPLCKGDEYLVPENSPIGTLIGSISCHDPDKDPQLSFSLDTNGANGAIGAGGVDLFSINSTTGSLYVAKNLRGRGRTAPYVFTILIEDGKERTTSLIIGVKVANVIPNDGKPQFTHEYFNASVPEGSPRGTSVFVVRAVDTDSFDNGEGRLSFHLSKQMYPCHSKMSREKITSITDVDFFRLDELSGVLSLKESLDREKMDCFSVLISVEDSGTPPQSEAEWFEIHVQDVDDSNPYLDPSERSLKLSVNESTKIGSVVHTFAGIDPDLYPNNLIAFEISGGGNDLFKVRPEGGQNASLILNTDLMLMEHDDLTLLIKCYPKDKKVNIPDCVSKVNLKVIRDTTGGGNGNYQLNSKTKYYEMILGASAGSPVGSLLGNAGMPRKIQSTGQMYHPSSGPKTSPYNVSSEAVHVDEETGDIFVWDNLAKYSNGHLRVSMVDESGGMKKNLKVFVVANDQLLSVGMGEYSKVQKWVDDTEGFLNSGGGDNKSAGGPKVQGHYRVLTFDQGTAPDGETRVCFQVLENENVISQEKALQILDNEDLQDIFLKYSVGSPQKGCPSKPRAPAKLSLTTAGTGRFWVERSLLGIASVVAIACISSILILCLLSKSRAKG